MTTETAQRSYRVRFKDGSDRIETARSEQAAGIQAARRAREACRGSYRTPAQEYAATTVDFVEKLPNVGKAAS